MASMLFLCSLFLFSASVRSSIVEQQTDVDQIDVDAFQKILARVEKLEKRDQDQQAEIDTLRQELNVEKQRTSFLEGVIMSHRSHDSESNDNIERKTGDDWLSMWQDSNKESRDSEKKTSRDPEEKTGRQSPGIVRRQAEVPVVAFHATLKDHQTHMGLHQSIAFDAVVTNIGGAYNPHFGSFVAPVQGVYVFYTKILGYHNNILDLSIVRNGVTVARLYERDHEGAFDHDSAMAVLHLSKGDDVAVQVNTADKFVNGYNHSMFCGFLLHADIQAENIIG